jgi:hypothetical protein
MRTKELMGGTQASVREIGEMGELVSWAERWAAAAVELLGRLAWEKGGKRGRG